MNILYDDGDDIDTRHDDNIVGNNKCEISKSEISHDDNKISQNKNEIKLEKIDSIYKRSGVVIVFLGAICILCSFFSVIVAQLLSDVLGYSKNSVFVFMFGTVSIICFLGFSFFEIKKYLDFFVQGSKSYLAMLVLIPLFTSIIICIVIQSNQSFDENIDARYFYIIIASSIPCIILDMVIYKKIKRMKDSIS